MKNLCFHVYTISPNQGKKVTVGYVATKEEAELLCGEHILYAYEVVHKRYDLTYGKPSVVVRS